MKELRCVTPDSETVGSKCVSTDSESVGSKCEFSDSEEDGCHIYIYLWLSMECVDLTLHVVCSSTCSVSL